MIRVVGHYSQTLHDCDNDVATLLLAFLILISVENKNPRVAHSVKVSELVQFLYLKKQVHFRNWVFFLFVLNFGFLIFYFLEFIKYLHGFF